jgi:RNA polymerase sigma-70 factor (ECF subfamily)
MDTPRIDMHTLQAQRSFLVRFAMLYLHDPHLAEDVAQETLLAALQGIGKFSGQSSLRTWLTGILKHKMLDLRRKQAHEVAFQPPAESEDSLEHLCDEIGRAHV